MRSASPSARVVTAVIAIEGKGGLRAAFFLLLGLVPPAAAFGHGDDQPKHGGIMGRGDDTVTVEFVYDGGVMAVYVEDHDSGTPIPAEKLKAASLGLHGPGRLPQQASLVPAGANKLIAEGLSPRVGDRLSTLLVLPDGMATWSIVTFRESRPARVESPPAGVGQAFALEELRIE